MTRVAFDRVSVRLLGIVAGRLLATGLLVAGSLLFAGSLAAAAEPRPLSSFDPQVKQLLAKMTLAEKIGQMTQPDQESIRDLADVETLFIGSVLSGGNSDPREGNSLEAWTNLYDRLQERAMKTRLGIPILYGIDALHGNNNVVGAVIFPHNIGLGCTRNAELVEKVGRITAEEVRATGVNWTFAPCVTVPQDERWGRTYEGFSEDPEITKVLGAAAVRGLQGASLDDPLSILACAKHYVGDGGTTAVGSSVNNAARIEQTLERLDEDMNGRVDDDEAQGDAWVAAKAMLQGAGVDSDPPIVIRAAALEAGRRAGQNPGMRGGARGGASARLDQGNTQVDEATLRRIHLPPYVTTVAAGVGSIMPSYSSWNGVKCSGSKQLLTDILKDEIGFQGFLISDYNAIDQIHPDYKQAIAISINAGMDMAMVPSRYREFITRLTELVNEGQVPMERIDDAVTRILRVKFAMGLMDKSRSPLADRGLAKTFGSPEHRAVAREAVRQSLVLLKNENRALPMAKGAARIHVAGKSADNIGNQCGGWTVAWQGQSGNVTTGGTTILAAIRAAVSADTKVTTSLDGTGAEGADVGVVVIGERPYAEGSGDRGDLSLDAADRQAVANMKKAGIPVVAILISGRPMILGDVLDQADALVAAWLPGTEGQGVADVLFGDAKPTGKLSFSWPRSMEQIPINVGDADYDPLFKVGDGLSY